MALKWGIAFLYFMLDWFIPGIGLPENLFALRVLVTPTFLILVILLFGKSLIEDFKKLKWREILVIVVIGMLLICLTNWLFDTGSRTNENVSVSWIYLLSAITYGPFFEEMILRYCMIPLSGSKWTKLLLLILSASFFSVIHGFSFTVSYFISGIIFGSIYLVKKNIWYSIIVHYINNLIAVGIILFYMS